MAHAFEAGQRVRVRDDAHLEDSVEQYRGRTGEVDHIVESTPELIFYSVAFSGTWDRGYIEGSCLEAARGGGGEQPP